MTKKEVLAKYGISYGALYRWKRMGLIPEEWFIKKASYTGQETYFKRDLICGRIDEIMRLKDRLSFEEIAAYFGVGDDESGKTFLRIDCGGMDYRLEAEKLRMIVVEKDGNMRDITEKIKEIIGNG